MPCCAREPVCVWGGSLAQHAATGPPHCCPWGWQHLPLLAGLLGSCQATSLFPLLFLSDLMDSIAWHLLHHALLGCASTPWFLEGGQGGAGRAAQHQPSPSPAAPARRRSRFQLCLLLLHLGAGPAVLRCGPAVLRCSPPVPRGPGSPRQCGAVPLGLRSRPVGVVGPALDAVPAAEKRLCLRAWTSPCLRWLPRPSHSAKL